MALRNAFENVATESTLGTIRNILNTISRNTFYAKTVTDQLRVNVDNGYIGSIGQINTQLFGASNGVPGYFSTGSPFASDSREMQRLQSEQAIMASMSRWTVS